ncbi:GNAT family N-acetyltransferase [Nonomuraea phyllanthi]|uniref:GNAT family N-acetyltransferase n=1 Tax=Nonomuraea phyllanthi TaxID=2219224 RepID=A0A5C4WRW6_9ACTN|nr:GNAT family N-acetyltransferase [Nonomuraea phyllanthi]KAB8196303.1 GNAT family N-acetyltransferase [Nonomuraea phyllanthi]QFY05400.1 GNAT family N-acetyltransferase [Nonomuraea phyllanthi]
MEWGPLTLEDARPVAELWAAMEAEDRTGEFHGVDDVVGLLSGDLIDLAEGTLAARDGDRIVAFGHLPVRQSADGVHLMHLAGGVHPAYRGRGLGRHIIDWSIRTAPGLSERAYPGVPPELQLDVYEGRDDLAALLEGAGFSAVRTFARMTRSLSGDLPVPVPPAGVSVAAWTPELDDGARDVRNEAFLDHWGSVRHTPESWRAIITGSRNFRPESSFVALAGDRAVGVLITYFFAAQPVPAGERQAWIHIVGTLREWRGKGVASTLIGHALATFMDQGYASAGLGVDAHNPTGAVSVYRRAGFEIVRRLTTYALPVKPA